MEKNKIRDRVKKILLSLALAVVCLFSCFFSIEINNHASASVEPPITPPTTEFNNTYVINFVHLLEEENKVYVLVDQSEEAEEYYATSINISTLLKGLRYINYKLEYVGRETIGVVSCYKYLVKDLQVSNNSKRVYDITCIYRPYKENDLVFSDDEYNTTTEKAFDVSKCYTFSTENGETTFSVLTTETIVVTDKFVGFVRYIGGVPGVPGLNHSCDRHFVAFSTDRQIDTLKEADVYFTTQFCEKISGGSSSLRYGNEIEEYVYLESSDKEIIRSGPLFFSKYSWDRIQTTEEFINSIGLKNVYSKSNFNNSIETEINDNLENLLNGKTHVLNFKETDYSDTVYTKPYLYEKEEKTIVGDVTILRLKFETGGTTFEYGVIDDKTTGSDKPITTIVSKLITNSLMDNVIEFFKDIKKLLIIFLLIVLVIILFPAILTLLPEILNFVIKIFKAIINFLIWLVKLPFKILKK